MLQHVLGYRCYINKPIHFLNIYFETIPLTFFNNLNHPHPIVVFSASQIAAKPKQRRVGIIL